MPSDGEPLSMLAFKIMNDPVRRLAHLLPHLFRQAANPASMLVNTVKERRERIGRMLLMHANQREEIKEAFAGDIVAIVGLKDTTTGDTLCDPPKPVILERMEFPEPVIEIAIEPNSKADQEKMGVALQPLAREDPSFRVKTDEESGQTIIAGMGELHLDIIVDRMKREFKVEATVGAAAGRLSRDDHAGRRDRLHAQEADRRLRPVRAHQDALRAARSRARASSSRTRSSAATCRRNTCRASRRASRASMNNGVVAGFPMVDIKATLLDGAYHEVDSSVLAFEIAGRAAFREGVQQGASGAARADHEGRGGDAGRLCRLVIGDLNSRRGQMQGTEMRGNATVINAMVPLANMFGYVNTLRSMSQGRAQYTMQFDHYAQVPSQVAQEIQSKYA